MRERESSSREERTPTVNTTLKAVVPPLESNRMPREDAKANKKGRDSFSNECRVSDEEEDAGQGFHNTHTGRQGWARSARKVNEEGFFLLQKKSLEKGLEGARALFVFEVGESVRAV